MKIRNKFNLLLILSAIYCLTTSSCGPKTSEGDTPERESSEIESIETASSTQETTEAESITQEATEALSSAKENKETVSLPEPTKGRGQWDESSLMYNDDSRKLFWDLSFFKDWNVFPEKKLPKNMMFAAENAGNGMVATLTVIPVGSDITSIWKMPKETYLKQSMEVQNKAFVKSTNNEPVIDKVDFRNRSAYQTTFTAEVPDHRNGQKTTHNYKIRKVALVNDGELIELTLMAPPKALERFGDDTFNFLIGKFNIID